MKNLSKIFIFFVLVNFFCLKVFAINNPQINPLFSSDLLKPGQEFTLTVTVENITGAVMKNSRINIPYIASISNTEYTSIADAILGTLDKNEKKSLIYKLKVKPDAKDPLIITDTKATSLEIYVHYNSGNDPKDLSFFVSINLPKLEDTSPKITKETLPGVFLKPGNTSTDLKSVTRDTASAFPKFRLDDPEANQITWDNLDLTDATLISSIAKIDTLVNISTLGKISVDSTNAKFLNKKATLLFRNLKFKSIPKIFKDTKEVDVNSASIKNLKFDAPTKSFSFDVDSFSEYVLGPVLTLTSLTQVNESYLLLANVNDPTAPVRYSLDGGKSFIKVVDVDLDTGNFRINLPKDLNKELFILQGGLEEIRDEKKLDKIGVQVSPTPTVLNDSKEEPKPFNIAFAYSIIAVLISFVVLIIIITIIVRKNRANKLSKSNEEVKSFKGDLDHVTDIKVKVLHNLDKPNASTRTIPNKDMASSNSWTRSTDKQEGMDPNS